VATEDSYHLRLMIIRRQQFQQVGLSLLLSSLLLLLLLPVSLAQRVKHALNQECVVLWQIERQETHLKPPSTLMCAFLLRFPGNHTI
jgi:hypothetical protein